MAVIGHPAAGDDPRFEAQPPAQRARLGPAAVDQDQADTEGREQADLARDVVQRLGILQHIAAELDDEDIVPVGPDIAQGALEAGDTLR